MTDVLHPPVKPGRTELATEQEARDVAEAAREKDWEARASSASCSRARSGST